MKNIIETLYSSHIVKKPVVEKWIDYNFCLIDDESLKRSIHSSELTEAVITMKKGRKTGISARERSVKIANRNWKNNKWKDK